MSVGRLLIIDDNLGDLVLLETALEHVGDAISVHTYTDASAALAELDVCPREELPRAILLDLNMPGLHGHEFLERVQDDERFGAVPIVVMSSSSIPSDVERSFALGARDHITKRVGIAAIREVMRGLRHHWSDDPEATSGT